jgi:hypothetical protein
VDRAGAASSETVTALVAELMAKHRHSLTSYNVCWRIWANHILSLKPTYRDQAKDEGPPAGMCHLFQLNTQDQTPVRGTYEEILGHAGREILSLGKTLDETLADSWK